MEQQRSARDEAKLAMWRLKQNHWQHLDKHSKRELASCMTELAKAWEVEEESQNGPSPHTSSAEVVEQHDRAELEL
jgi:hypothetical protein